MSDYADIDEVVSSGDIGTAMDSDAWNAWASNYANLGSGIDWSNLVSKYGSTAAGLIGAGLGASGLLGGSQQKSGYQGGIPSLTATRQQLPIDYNADRRPGSMGRRYFTDMVYAPKATAPAPVEPAAPVTPAPEVPVNDVGGAAQGGMIGYAQGGIANLGYYLGGATDGMADKIPASIEGKQKAALSHGEFVIPADIVSALGSGNSSAGAKVLYSMMDRVRQHAHGTKKQIKPANLKKTLPA
jgi:hypothetical protein